MNNDPASLTDPDGLRVGDHREMAWSNRNNQYFWDAYLIDALEYLNTNHIAQFIATTGWGEGGSVGVTSLYNGEAKSCFAYLTGQKYNPNGNGGLGDGDDLVPPDAKIVKTTLTSIIYSTSNGYLAVSVEPQFTRFAPEHFNNFDGFWGKVSWFFDNRVGRGKYDWNGNYEGIAPIGGTAPIPSFSGVKIAGTINTVSRLWSTTKKLKAAENAMAHFAKHGREFDEFYNATQYAKGAKEFLTNSPAGTLVKIRANGDILKYHPPTNTFGVMNSGGAPKTLFKPLNGLAYWLAQ